MVLGPADGVTCRLRRLPPGRGCPANVVRLRFLAPCAPPGLQREVPRDDHASVAGRGWRFSAEAREQAAGLECSEGGSRRWTARAEVLRSKVLRSKVLRSKGPLVRGKAPGPRPPDDCPGCSAPGARALVPPEWDGGFHWRV